LLQQQARKLALLLLVEVEEDGYIPEEDKIGDDQQMRSAATREKGKSTTRVE